MSKRKTIFFTDGERSGVEVPTRDLRPGDWLYNVMGKPEKVLAVSTYTRPLFNRDAKSGQVRERDAIITAVALEDDSMSALYRVSEFWSGQLQLRKSRG